MLAITPVINRNPCGAPFITPHGFLFPAVLAVACEQFKPKQQAHNPGNNSFIAQIGRV